LNDVYTYLYKVEWCIIIIMKKERLLIRNGSRILTPAQHYRLREALDPNGGYRIIIDGLINTGARVVEFWKIVKNPQWYHASRRLIDLPSIGACKKPMCTQTDRTIKLTERGCAALDIIYSSEIEYRDPASMNQALKRAAKKAGFEHVEGINSKMYRKILISWLIECRKDLGIDSSDIQASMGHTEDTMIASYLGIGFDEQEHADMLAFVKGWG